MCLISSPKSTPRQSFPSSSTDPYAPTQSVPARRSIYTPAPRNSPVPQFPELLSLPPAPLPRSSGIPSTFHTRENLNETARKTGGLEPGWKTIETHENINQRPRVRGGLEPGWETIETHENINQGPRVRGGLEPGWKTIETHPAYHAYTQARGGLKDDSATFETHGSFAENQAEALANLNHVGEEFGGYSPRRKKRRDSRVLYDAVDSPQMMQSGEEQLVTVYDGNVNGYGYAVDDKKRSRKKGDGGNGTRQQRSSYYG